MWGHWQANKNVQRVTIYGLLENKNSSSKKIFLPKNMVKV